MRDYKVALCFSGQPRAWKIAEPSIRQFIGEFSTPPDTFFHLWNFNSTSNHVVGATGGNVKKDEEISQEELNNLLHSYLPKKVVVENSTKSKSIRDRAFFKMYNLLGEKKFSQIKGTADWLAPQYYSIKRSAELKSEYEVENGFYYDVVIRMRYDLFLPELSRKYFFNLTQDLKIDPFNLYGTHIHQIYHYPNCIVGDVFYFADSFTYNSIAEYISFLPHVFANTYDLDLTPEELFAYFIQSSFFKINPLEVDPKVARSKEYFEQLKANGHSPYLCDIGEHYKNYPFKKLI